MHPRTTSALTILTLLIVALVSTGCEFEHVEGPRAPTDSLRASPSQITLLAGESHDFGIRMLTGVSSIAWRQISGPGTMSGGGRYQAPVTVAGDEDTAVVEVWSPAGEALAGRALIRIIADSTRRVCFAREVKPVFVENCARAACHDPATRQHGYDFTQDHMITRGVIAGRPDQSEIYLAITNPDDSEHRMPPPPHPRLRTEQIAAIERWIVEGARMTTCAPPGEDCGIAGVRYSTVISVIMREQCTAACHEQATSTNGGIDLTTHAGTSAVAHSGQLLGSVTHALGYVPMPTATTKLDSCDIERIRAWVNAGAPND